MITSKSLIQSLFLFGIINGTLQGSVFGSFKIISRRNLNIFSSDFPCLKKTDAIFFRFLELSNDKFLNEMIVQNCLNQLQSFRKWSYFSVDNSQKILKVVYEYYNDGWQADLWFTRNNFKRYLSAAISGVVNY